MKPEINYADFEKIDLRVGTIIAVEVNEKAKKAAYVLQIDFGSEIGIKKIIRADYNVVYIRGIKGKTNNCCC